MQISRSKPDSLHRTPAGFTALALDGYGLCDILPARPTSTASYPVSVRRVATLLHASFRQSLAVLPLRFASASPPSGCTGDLHPQNCRTCPTHRTLRAGFAGGLRPVLTQAARDGAEQAGRDGETPLDQQRNTVTMAVAPTQDSTSDWREVGAQVNSFPVGVAGAFPPNRRPRLGKAAAPHTTGACNVGSGLHGLRRRYTGNR